MSAERPAVVLALTPVAERAIEPLLFGAQAVVEPLASVGEADEPRRVLRNGDRARGLRLCRGLVIV